MGGRQDNSCVEDDTCIQRILAPFASFCLGEFKLMVCKLWRESMGFYSEITGAEKASLYPALTQVNRQTLTDSQRGVPHAALVAALQLGGPGEQSRATPLPHPGWMGTAEALLRRGSARRRGDEQRGPAPPARGPQRHPVAAPGSAPGSPPGSAPGSAGPALGLRARCGTASPAGSSGSRGTAQHPASSGGAELCCRHILQLNL